MCGVGLAITSRGARAALRRILWCNTATITVLSGGAWPSNGPVRCVRDWQFDSHDRALPRAQHNALMKRNLFWRVSAFGQSASLSQIDDGMSEPPELLG